MMTPQEAEAHVFSRAGFSGGYHMGQVDAFLDRLLPDYAVLFQENADLKQKLKILASHVEEYRQREESIQRTLLHAQQTADEILREAEATKTQALATAEEQNKHRIEELQNAIMAEEDRLIAAQQATLDYIEQSKQLCQRSSEFFNHMSERYAPNHVEEKPTPVPAPEFIATPPPMVDANISSVIDMVQAEIPRVHAQETTQKTIYINQATKAPPLDTSLPSHDLSEPTKKIPIPPEAQSSPAEASLDTLEYGKDYTLE